MYLQNETFDPASSLTDIRPDRFTSHYLLERRQADLANLTALHNRVRQSKRQKKD